MENLNTTIDPVELAKQDFEKEFEEWKESELLRYRFLRSIIGRFSGVMLILTFILLIISVITFRLDWVLANVKQEYKDVYMEITALLLAVSVTRFLIFITIGYKLKPLQSVLDEYNSKFPEEELLKQYKSMMCESLKLENQRKESQKKQQEIKKVRSSDEYKQAIKSTVCA
jgi:succinate dehydrogenase hydrophobic anchor subunit